MTRKKFNSHKTVSGREWLVGERIHIDVWGPYAVESYFGKRYFALCVDDASRFSTLYLLKGRSETYEKFKIYCESVKTQLKVRMKSLRYDNARELSALAEWCNQKYAMIYPKHSGLKLLCRLFTASTSFRICREEWKYHIQCGFASHLNILDFERLVVKFWHTLTTNGSKAREAVFVGYPRESRGYRLLNSKTNKSFYSHTVIFYEAKPGRILIGSGSTPTTNVPTAEYLDIDTATLQTSHHY
ncbi:hypothetical protein PHMEG_00010078 [Phytophthora megakarya]|uniref:Retroviral polymerase SH3-like domain-containing protein n=1 Tax=Phytophthora megakarya TaxID=4795 RepID=A0A225WEL6_9STRA|nr:hypothetical protein PHMEG_00010078 [Phytophthora megakarya]